MLRFLVSAIIALASPLLADKPLDIRLVSAVTTVRPGQPFYIALSLEHGRGFHTYWKFPGIVGVPTSIQWKQVPKGWKIGEIQWPEPERTLMFQIKAQGFDRDVVLPMLVTPPADAQPGETVTLKGLASWMCCADSCHPGFGELEITLPIAAEEPAITKWRKLIDAELARPVQESSAWAAEASVTETSATVKLIPREGAKALKQREVGKLIYFTEDGVIDSDKPQVLELQPDGSLLMHLQRADSVVGGFKGRLTGVLVRPGGWQADGSIRAMRVSARAAVR